jgi:outer membrane protein assembly factor BamB
VRGGVVYFGCRDSYVYAVDAGTGKQIWKFSTDGSWVNNSLVADSDAVYFATSIPGILHAVNAKTGASLFHLPTGTPVFASMALANGNLYMGNFAGKLTAIDIRAQKPIWSFETEAARQNAPALTSADGSIKFETVFPSPKLFYNDMVVAVDKLFSMGSILSSPVPVRDMVLVGSTDENLYALW